MKHQRIKTKEIEEAMKYAMGFYSIQEHELQHSTDYIKNHIADILDGSQSPILNNTEKKIIMLAARYLGEKK